MPTRKTIGTENLVGQNILFLRRAKKMKQAQLLAQLQTRGIDISQSALSDIEGQNRKVSDRELFALAEIFGISVDTLFSLPEQ